MDVQETFRRSRHRDLGFAIVLLVACLIGSTQPQRPIIVDVVLAVCAVVAPFTRWRWPLPTVAVVAAVLVVCAFVEEMPTGVIALAPFAAYIVRRHISAPQRDYITAALLFGDMVALTFIAPPLAVLESAEKAPYVAWSVTLIITAILFGELRRRAEETAARELQTEMARQRDEFERAAEEERAHLAREIHDIVTHSLTVIVAQADGALYAAASGNPSTNDDALRTIGRVGRESLRQMRGVVGLLRGSEQRPVAPLVAELDIEKLVSTSRAGGLEVDYAAHGEPPGDLAPATTLAVQRVIQESLTNALKHGTGSARLTVDWTEDNVAIRTTNPIRGGATRSPQGNGLRGMQERVSLIDGSVRAATTDHHTWITEATIPLKVAQ